MERRTKYWVLVAFILFFIFFVPIIPLPITIPPDSCAANPSGPCYASSFYLGSVTRSLFGLGAHFWGKTQAQVAVFNYGFDT